MAFLGLEWYWWLAIVAALVILLPLKIRFMKWWGRHRQEKEKEQRGKWGNLWLFGAEWLREIDNPENTHRNFKRVWR